MILKLGLRQKVVLSSGLKAKLELEAKLKLQ